MCYYGVEFRIASYNIKYSIVGFLGFSEFEVLTVLNLPDYLRQVLFVKNNRNVSLFRRYLKLMSPQIHKACRLKPGSHGTLCLVEKCQLPAERDPSSIPFQDRRRTGHCEVYLHETNQAIRTLR